MVVRSPWIAMTLALVLLGVGCLSAVDAHAENPTRQCHVVWQNGKITSTCEESGSSPGSTPSDTTNEGPSICIDEWDGKEIPCEADGYYWYSNFQAYCLFYDAPDDDPEWKDHRDTEGNPIGALYECKIFWFVESWIPPSSLIFVLWAPTVVSTPDVGSGAQTWAFQVVESLGLNPPTVGASAYVYPEFKEFGFGWWVGAPMWLWLDKNDEWQWGEHTTGASAGGASISATVKSTKVTFDPGNGDTPVVCYGPGTPRPWNPDDPLERHSPSKCEYTYRKTSELGNTKSHFPVSATVTWNVKWQTNNGEAGKFTFEVPSTSPMLVHVGIREAVLVNPSHRPT